VETAHLIDSSSMGDPARHRVRRELDELWASLPAAPSDLGTLALLVRRVEGGRRETPAEAILDPVSGLPGDAWERRPERKIEAQLTVMQLDIARLIANGQPLTLFGDNVFTDLDLSARNLPIGTRVRIGEAMLEVTPKPHNGCKKFNTRFGEDALRFVSDPAQRHRNFRGIYLCVIERGVAKLGDDFEVISRGSPSC
jgi:hypothetical protein